MTEPTAVWTTRNAPTRTIGAAGAWFTSRGLGPAAVPPVLLTHLDLARLRARTTGRDERVTPGVVFQNHRAFVDAARDFLRR